MKSIMDNMGFNLTQTEHDKIARDVAALLRESGMEISSLDLKGIFSRAEYHLQPRVIVSRDGVADREYIAGSNELSSVISAMVNNGIPFSVKPTIPDRK